MFPHTKVVFIEARVTAGTSPLEGIRSSLATVFTEISGGGIRNLKILWNRKTGGPEPITSASLIPLKWGQASKYVPCLNNRANLTKRITGNKLRIFKLIITLGSEEDINKTVEENAVHVTQGGIIVEVKRLQVIHYKKGLLIAMLPKSIDLKYMQETAQACLIKAVHKSINESNESTTKIGIAKEMDFKILADCGYPPLNFKKFKNGSKPNYNIQNKQMSSIEYNE